MAETPADGRLGERAALLDRLHRDAPLLELPELPYRQPLVIAARMPDVLCNDFCRASLAVHAFICEKGIELLKREAVEPLVEGVAGWRDMLRLLGTRLRQRTDLLRTM